MREPLALMVILLGSGALAAQSRASRPESPATHATENIIEWGYHQLQVQEDQYIWLLSGGVRIAPRKGYEIRADTGVVTLDRDAFADRMPKPGDKGGLPRRSLAPPDPGRELDAEALRARLESFVRSAKRGATARPSEAEPKLPADDSLELFRTLYLEGNVLVIQDGIEVVRCKRLWLSLLDDRAVFEDVEMRLKSVDKKTNQQRLVTLRAPKITRQGSRMVARDISVSSCTAGVPHIDMQSKEAEIIERGDALEIRAAGNSLRLSGTSVLPLPSYSFLTSDESEVPLQGVSGGFSSREGAEASVRFGSNWNSIGGDLHHALTGRPKEEFHGKWSADLGWIEERGFPFRGNLEYGAENLYRGRTYGFFLDDDGKNIREIHNYLDGTPITTRERTLIHTENRVHLSDGTTLDLTLHTASDPSVLPEFYNRQYHEDEIPETSVYLRSAADNRLFTAIGRVNLDNWSYTDSRALAPSFLEQRPYVTYDWFSEPIAKTPFGTPLLLTSSSSFGYLRHKFDPRGPAETEDDTLRVDQELELAAPFTLGPIAVRPFTSVRATHFDETNVGGDYDRLAYAGGLSLGSRLSKTYSWMGDDGQRKAIRHVVSPVLTWVDRWHVDGDPANFRSFDTVDTLTETNEIRLEVLNRLQKMKTSTDKKTPGVREIDDFVWLDLAQTVYSEAKRDNAGHDLGLFEYELILRPDLPWSPVPNPRFLIEGERDWNARKWRTANFGVAFGPVLGINWQGEYRTYETERGQIGYGGSASFFERWVVSGATQYDLDLHRTNNYSAEIVRVDHDWRLHLRLSYDNVSGNTSFTIDFEPTVGGLFQPKGQRHWVPGSRLFDTGDFTRY